MLKEQMTVKKTRKTLSNGLSLLVVEIPGSKSSAVSYWVKAGTRKNPGGKEGLAHFLEHILLKKTRKYASDKKLAFTLENYGAYKNGWTGRDEVYYTIHAPTERVDKTLNILSEIVGRPLIDKNSMDSEREVIKKEIIRAESNPERYVWDVWYKSFFAGTSLQNSTLGTEESLGNINVKDLQDFWKHNYLTEGDLLFVCGGEKTDRVYDFAEKHFGRIKIKKEKSHGVMKLGDAARISVDKKTISQASIILSFEADLVGRDMRYKTYMLNAILSSGWSSRLMQRLRAEESLIYRRRGSMHRYFDKGALLIELSTSSEKFPRMLTTLSEELKKLKHSKVGDRELRRVKNFSEGVLISETQTPSDYLQWYGHYELFWPKDSESVEDWINGINTVSSEDIIKMARKYFVNTNWHMGIVGDIDEKSIEFSVS